MFKSKKQRHEAAKDIPVAPNQPQKTPEQAQAEKVIARGERIKRLSEEAAMWRSFTAECVAGRFIHEHTSLYDYATPRLSLRMDEDTALLWREFAHRMADERESRLRDALNT